MVDSEALTGIRVESNMKRLMRINFAVVLDLERFILAIMCGSLSQFVLCA